MAARNFSPIKALEKNMVIITGSFRPNGSSTISSTYNSTLGWSVARTSSGLFTVTLDDRYAELVALHVSFALVTAADLNPQIGTVTVSMSAAGTFQIRALAGSTLTDIASNAANRVYFTAFLRNGQAV